MTFITVIACAAALIRVLIVRARQKEAPGQRVECIERSILRFIRIAFLIWAALVLLLIIFLAISVA